MPGGSMIDLMRSSPERTSHIGSKGIQGSHLSVGLEQEAAVWRAWG